MSINVRVQDAPEWAQDSNRPVQVTLAWAPEHGASFNLTRAQAADLREQIANWERENRKSRRRSERPANHPAPEGILPNTSWPPDPEWVTDERGRFHYMDYDGESLHVWRDKDGELWIDKKGEGPVYVRGEDVALITSALTGEEPQP